MHPTFTSKPLQLVTDGPKIAIVFRFPTCEEGWDYWATTHGFDSRRPPVKRPDQSDDEAVPDNAMNAVDIEQNRHETKLGLSLVVGMEIDGKADERSAEEIRAEVGSDFRFAITLLVHARLLFRLSPISGDSGADGSGGTAEVRAVGADGGGASN